MSLSSSEIRFKDDNANDFPDWGEKKLGDIGNLYQPKTISQTDLTSEGFTVYGANGIIGKYHSFNHEKSQVTVTCRGSTCGVIGYTEPHSWITGNAMVVNLDEHPDSTKTFVYHALCATDLRYLITGSGQPQITGNLKGHKIGYPSLPEQKKIADFLTSVDERIGQLIKKKALLEDYKKGVMQQLFSQQIRFKDDNGNDFPDWEEVVLQDVVDRSKRWSFTGGPFGSNLKSEDYTDDGIRIIQLQNIGDGEFLNDYKIYTSEKKADELLSCNIYPDDLLLSKMGDPVARVCIVPSHSSRYVMCSDGIRLAVDETRFDRYFVFCQINHRTFRNAAIAVGTGSTRKRIGLTELRELPLGAPSLPEQIKIGKFLAAIDSNIKSVSQQIAKTQTFKKGLLQQMFV